MIRKLCVACFFSLCLTSLSTAATITVAQAGGADQTTILGALAAANSGDVIQINDSATYTEALPNSINTGAGGAILDSLTIQVAAGMTPTIENTSATGFIFGPGSATTTVSGPFVIQGASNTARLNLRTAANPAVGGGPNLASTHAITLENTNIVRTTAGTYVQANNQGNWLLNNVDFIGAPNFGGTMVLYGVNPPPAGPWAGSFTGNNVDMRPGGAANKLAVYGGTMVWNNSEIGTADGGPAATGLILASVPAANPSTSVTFNDCLVAPGRPADGVAQGGRWVGGAGQMGPLTMTLNRCTLGYTFEVACRIPNGLQVTVAGTPTAKTSIDPMINRSTTSPPCVLVLWSFDQANSVGRSGALTLRDVMGTTYPNAPNQLFRHAGADQMTDNLTVERCYFENCAAGNGAFAQSAGPGLNATFINTILKGPFNDGLSGGVFFLCNAGTLNLNMTHCTLIGANPVDTSLMRFFNTTTQGFVNADYCIFDDRQMGTGYGSNNLKGLFGKISMVCAGSNFGQPIPTDWIVGTAADPIDPKLTATGRLTDLTSPAIGGAVGEMVQGAIDIDGNSRPLTKSDLGASQTPFPNASSGWAEFR